MTYIVVICPKCRKHAQIIEQGNKTTICQHCGTRLQVKKLRVFFTSDDLSEAVEARTRQQAHLFGDGAPTLSFAAGGFRNTT